MLYSAWDREINISLFFATFLYENEALGLEQAAVVTMARDRTTAHANLDILGTEGPALVMPWNMEG